MEEAKKYKFKDCNCIGQAKRNHTKKTLCCEKHRNSVAVLRVFTCAHCGKTCEVFFKNTKSFRCTDCQRKIDLEKRKAYNSWYISKKKAMLAGVSFSNDEYQRERERKREIRLMSKKQRRADCEHYAECLMLTGALMQDPAACVKCSKYNPVSIIRTHLLEYQVSEREDMTRRDEVA